MDFGLHCSVSKEMELVVKSVDLILQAPWGYMEGPETLIISAPIVISVFVCNDPI